MDDDNISDFLGSIRRQLRESQIIWMKTGHKAAPNPGTSAKLAIEGMPTDYVDAIRDLYENIQAYRHTMNGNRMKELGSLTLLSPALIWMVPAFCYCAHFLDPLDAEERCVAIQKTRLAREASFTDDIWDQDLIHDWAGSDGSRLLLLQGNSRTTKRFERFAVEIVQAVKSFHPSQPARLVYVLNSPRSAGHSSQVRPLDLLQQVAVQCLQYATPEEPVKFLIGICSRFHDAQTTQDWFGILRDICILIPSLYVIIDLAILGRTDKETEFWPAQFEDMFHHLGNSTPRSRLKVMLLFRHSFISQEGETLVIKAPPSGLASPRRHTARKQFHRLVEDQEDTPFNENFEAVDILPKRHLAAQSPSSSLKTFSVQVPSATSSAPSRITHRDFETQSSSEPRHRHDFKIAIICALTLESDAVQDVFDNRWDEVKYGKTRGDPNQYTTGVIGHHNVVVVHMPGMGKSNAAVAAANCRASFPNLGLVLVVGICGGVPFPRNGVEIVLGDIIISDGLIQYDFGRQFPDRFVRKDDTIARPNSEILAFLFKTKGRWGMKKLRERTAVHLEYLRNSTDLSGIADYPGASRDKLYEPTYRHKHQAASTCKACNSCQTRNDPVCQASLTSDCERLQCDDKYLIFRRRLFVLDDEEENQKIPSIHFGLYASGDKVMKSGEEREIIAKEEGVVAFEMEGAGVWEGFPGRCLVIKAVCDYADSHKNKIWQTYAAASAAACTKAVLESWSP